MKWYLLYSEKDIRPDVDHDWERQVELKVDNVDSIGAAMTIEAECRLALLVAENTWLGIIESYKNQPDRFINPRVAWMISLELSGPKPTSD